MDDDLLKTTICSTLAKIAKLYADRAQGKTEGDFYDDVFSKMPTATTDGNQLCEDFFAEIDDESLSAWGPLEIYPAVIACAFCIEAIREGKNGKIDRGWLSLTKANWWLGGGIFAGSVDPHEYASHAGKRAANARHAENRDIAERIKAWYGENHHRYRSMDAAAEAAARIEPISVRTARKHIGAAAKNIPSTRKV